MKELVFAEPGNFLQTFRQRILLENQNTLYKDQ